MHNERQLYDKKHRWSGLMFGFGLAGFIDEMVFHQFLQWHHFYDQMTREVGLFSDGVLNAMCGFLLFLVCFYWQMRDGNSARIGYFGLVEY